MEALLHYSSLHYSSNPAVLVLLVIVIAWIWEDASLIAGALLAADGQLTIPLALVAIFVGICSGDLGLYCLGRLAHRWRKLRAWILTNAASRAVGRRFRRSTISNIVIIRFIPGLRTVGFTMCGLWRIAVLRFIIAMSVAGIFWIALVFTLVYSLGTSEWLQDSRWKWSLMGIALGLLVVNNFCLHRHAKKVRAG